MRQKAGILAWCCVLAAALSQPTFLFADGMEDALDRADYPPAQERAIRAVFERADQRDVPSQLLLPRLQQGIAKSVSAPRVAQALEHDLRALLHARDAVLQTPAGDAIVDDTASWARAANLLDAGRSTEELRNLAGVCAERPEAFRPATSLYVSAVDWGLEESAALGLVEAAVDSSLPASDLPGITRLLVEGRRARIRPDRLVQRMVATLPHVDSLSELRNRTLE
jgi:hypothetical protein